MESTLSNKTTTEGSRMKIGTEDRMKIKVALVTFDHELRTRGIRVLVIEPANTNTQFEANLLQPDAKLDEYREVRAALARQMESLVESGDKPSIVAETVLKAALAVRPKLRYPVGRGIALSRMRRFVPAGMFDKSLRKQFQLD
jgi:short-subunit dehydrogenase